MREPIFKTRIPDLLGITHPILCDGLRPGVSDAPYVAAVLDFGPAVVFADEIEPVETIFDRPIDDAVAAIYRLEALRCPTAADHG